MISKKMYTQKISMSQFNGYDHRANNGNHSMFKKPEVIAIMGLELGEALLMGHGDYKCKGGEGIGSSYSCGIQNLCYRLNSTELPDDEMFTVLHPQEYRGKKVAVARVKARKVGHLKHKVK